MQKITPFLWFNDNAEEAVNFYCSIFKNAQIISTVPGPGGKVLTVDFELDGQRFAAINGGPMFTFTEAVSFVVSCDSQEEIDMYWDKLTEDGQESMCAWLKDKYGLSWQIVPPILIQLLKDKDGAKSQRVMQAMLKMKKIIIADLKKAAEG